jgi:ankyrin repeat protein
MNLEQLRKQAKELVKAARGGGEEALERLDGREPILANAQLALAREHGYASWPALVLAAEANADAFVRAATDARRARADALLAARPEIARDPWARLVLGHGWDSDPNRPGGPRGWAPLLYVCHSVYAAVDLARELLDGGADPNACAQEEWGTTTALYGAAGVVHHPIVTRLLLEAGANPDDDESLYHSVEADDPECLRLLLEHGARTSDTNALPHALDYDRIEPVRLLLEAGADPNEHAEIAHAIRRGRGPEFVRLLHEFGADLDRPGGETWRGDAELRTPYAHAVLRGRDDVARTLEELGASTDLPPGDAGVAAIAHGERPAEPLPDELDYDAQEVLILSALRGSLDVVVETVGVDFAGVVGGSPPGTLLHHAAWMADADVVRELLARGADPNAPSPADLETPLAWAVYGSRQAPTRHRDYVAVAEQLAAAGAELDPRFLQGADGPLLEWLQLRLPGEL